MRIKRKKNEKKDQKSLKRKVGSYGPKYWMTMGAMSAVLAYSSIDSKTTTPVYAQGSPAAVAVSYWQSQTQARRFDIPPGYLDKVLNSFKSVTGLQVVIPEQEISNILSPGVSGIYTNDQALKQLLAGTGVGYKLTAPDTVTLEIIGPASSVVVMGRVSPLSSPKYTEPLRDVPQTINVVPKAVIEEQGATTLREVLQNIPGITVTAGEGGTPAGDNLTLRGFNARNDIFIDGVRDLGAQSRDPFNLEQVEVVKGPGSVYSGRGSACGIINLVSKSPLPNRLIGGSVTLGNAETKRVTADVNLPIKDRSAFRLNFMAHDAVVPGREDVDNQRWGIAPSLALGMGTRTRLNFSFYHLQQDNTSDYGIPWVPVTNNVLVEFRDRPAPVPRDTFYGFKSRDKEKLRSDFATIGIEYDLNDSTTLRNQFRYGQSKRDSIATPPRFASTDSTVINREMRSWIATDDITDNQTDLRSRFSTGSIQHSLVGGISFSNEANVRRNRTAVNSPTTLLNPNPNDIFTEPIIIAPNIGSITGKTLGVYAFDTVRLGQQWEVSGGLRFDYFDVDGVSTANATVSRVDQMLSWRAGVVYKPKQHGSIYASYGTSLSPSLEGLSYVTANTFIEPEETYTAEVGTKWDVFGERLSVSGALFRVDKTNARTPGLLPDDPPQVLDGEQRVDGVELSVSGYVTREWNVLVAYTYLDSEILKSNVGFLTGGPFEVGNQLQNTPKHSGSFWTTYRFPWKFTVGGGIRYVDRRFGNNLNTRFVDEFWLGDLMASYSVTKNVDLRLNISNLTDEYYFDRLGGGHLIPGAGRLVLFSTSFKF